MSTREGTQNFLLTGYVKQVSSLVLKYVTAYSANFDPKYLHRY